MIRRLSALLVPAIAVVSFGLPSAQADHGCNGTVTDLGGAVYVDEREDLWIYVETNGVAGLQSGGDQVAGLWADSCSHANPDTLIY